MKKILSIALAVLVGLTAIASLAIVPRDADPSGKKVYFDSVSISTMYSLATYTLPGASSIADAGKAYNGNELLFGYLKFIYNDNNPDAAEDITLHISSANATFPMYLNTGGAVGVTGNAVVHFVDKNGILQYFNTPAQTFFDITANTGDEEFTVFFDASDFDAYGTLHNYATNPLQLPKKTDKFVVDMYVGFNAVVKASTALTGKISVYSVTAGSSFANSNAGKTDWNAWTGLQEVGVNAGGVNGYWGNILAPYIDIYDNGTHLYRVYSLFNNNVFLDGDAESIAFEYLVQPTDPADRDKLLSWAVGFQNYDKNRFFKVTYREELPTTKARWNGTVLPVLTRASDNAATEAGLDLCWTNGAGIAASDDASKVYKFYKVKNLATTFNDDIKVANQLDSKIMPIMDWFGFNFGYYNATRDKDYENKAGWKKYSDAEFKYFGAEVPTDDEDVVPAETGDASASIVIILGASAILAAAALFFVMKKARD